MKLPSALRSDRLADAVLEATILGSFTRIGPAARSRLENWEEIDVDMTGQFVVVTGSSSGIGKEVARELVDLGADVVVTSRSLDRAEEAATEIEQTSSGDGSAQGAALNTAEFESIADFVQLLSGETREIDVLIHNAGALSDSYRTNDRGTELTVASHLIGPYALTAQLREQLSYGAKVLWMSSGGMYTQGLDVDKLEMAEDEYRGAVAYARAKRAQVEMVQYLGPQWAPEIEMHSMHPGWVDTGGVSDGIPLFGKIMGPLLRSVELGADTMVWLATGGAEGRRPGQFWLDRDTRGTVYLPGTSTDDQERKRLVEWLDLRTLPAHLEQ